MRIGVRWIYLLLLALGARVTTAGDSWRQEVEMSENSGVSITITSAFGQLPPYGYLPFKITIDNRSGDARSYTFQCSAKNSGSQHDGTRTLTQEVRVEAGSVGTFEMLMPLLALGGTGYAPAPRIDVSGYAVVDGDLYFPSRSISTAASPYVAMSSVLATRSWGPLAKELKAQGSKELIGTDLNVAALPSQWRGLLGVGCLWLTDAELIGLRPEQRAAIRDWVAQGGELFCCTQTLADEVRKELGLVLNQSSEARVGFGRVKLIPWDGHELAASAIRARAEQCFSEPLEARLRRIRARGADRRCGGSAALQCALPHRLHHRLCRDRRAAQSLLVGRWCTAASPLLDDSAHLPRGQSAARRGHSLQDGFGGVGKRVLLTYILPGEKKAVILQEQVTRTGVLLGREFDVQEDVFLTPLLVPTREAGMRHAIITRAGAATGSEWFSSRSVEAHLATAVVPTRAEIRVLNANQISEEQPPVIISHIPVTLRELVILDRNMARWVGSNVRTGERTTLTRAAGKGNVIFPKARCAARCT
jgi:hypothetical protein